MADILGTNVDLPSFSMGIGSINWMLILIVFMFVIVGGILIFILMDRKKYNKKIILFENIAGQGYQVTKRDRARLVKVGDGGEEILFLKKLKVYRTAYGKKMGKNQYWFAVGQDGYWYNIILGDLDAKMGMLDIEPIDRDMRYMHVAIRKNIQERYKKQNFMEKYGSILMNGLFLIIMLVGLGVLISKMADTANVINTGITTANELMATSRDLLTSMGNICNGGSGNLIPVQ